MQKKKDETQPQKIARVFLAGIKDRPTRPSRIAHLVFGSSGKRITEALKSRISEANKLLKERGLGLIVSERLHGRIVTMHLASPDDPLATQEEVLRGKRRVESAAQSWIGTIRVAQKLKLLPPAELKQIAPRVCVQALNDHLLTDGS